MTRHATYQRSVDLVHITSPEVGMEMIASGAYRSFNNFGHYDGGMNFCGVLGQVPNTHPKGQGARLHCKWDGPVSVPLPPAAYDYHTPNVLFDFNGSGQHYQNKDPRYFLPYGSAVQVLKLECDPMQLEDYYLSRSRWWKKVRFKYGSTAYRRKQLQSLLDYCNQKCAEGFVHIRVERGHPTVSDCGEFFR